MAQHCCTITRHTTSHRSSQPLIQQRFDWYNPDFNSMALPRKVQASRGEDLKMGFHGQNLAKGVPEVGQVLVASQP